MTVPQAEVETLRRDLAEARAELAASTARNARLSDDFASRSRELDEALARQTATADVLKVISRSPSDLKPVLDAIADTAARLCGSEMTMFFRFDGEAFRILASWNFPPDVQAMLEAKAPAPGHPSALGRAGATLKPAYIPDVAADPGYGLKVEQNRARYRATLAVPMLREGRLVGALSLNRSEPGSFTSNHIALVSTFADQAAIAFENVRLFEEVRARTRDLEEALAQQTATADALKVISRSALGLRETMQTLIDSAVRLSADDGVVYLRKGGVFLAEAAFDADEEKIRARNRTPRAPGRGSMTGRVALSGDIEFIPDTLADREFEVAPDLRLKGIRSLVGVPLLRDGRVEGVFILGKRAPGRFGARAVELARTFADQAVIVIENVRLFEEARARTRDLEESLSQQTATAEVLKVISRSAFDLQAVLNTLIGSAVTLCGADNCAIYLERDSAFVVGAHYDPASEPEFFEMLKRQPQRPGWSSAGARVLLTGETQIIHDISLDEDYDPVLRRATTSRALLGVPLKRDGAVVGAIVLARRTPGPFAPRQIELAETFADQAVIAIENSRLLDEVRARTRELEQSLSDLRKTQDRLVQSEKLASLGQLTAGIAHEIKNPLNFVNNFAALSRDLLSELKDTLAQAPLAERVRDEIEDLTGLLDSNLQKVVNHGQRADSIVKNMLLHSREGSGERARVSVNAMVEEALNLAYHGARAEKPGFSVSIEKTLDAEAGEADLYLQEITRVLLNLISNGFYATAKRREAEGPHYQPTLSASTRSLGGLVEIRIRDNGPGIPDDVRAKMFNPFFTTKPAGEGTGLGLSLSHDIVVKQHGGRIEVETAPGAFTEFVVLLPREGAKS